MHCQNCGCENTSWDIEYCCPACRREAEGENELDVPIPYVLVRHEEEYND